MTGSEDTIVARATARGEGAIGIVRLSGGAALAVVSRFVVLQHGGELSAVAPRVMVGVEVRFEGEVLDRGLFVHFASPASVTGEDVVELHLHGNVLIVDRVESLCVSFGARMARPGEFTLRSFLNGKIDLTQAEGLAEVIRSESEAGIRLAQRHLGGEFRERLQELRGRVVHLLGRLELELDFAEEGYSFVSAEERTLLLEDVRSLCRELLQSGRAGVLLRRGPRVLLLGRPNAGKSSLFNAILGYSRALVSETAGTTRDYLEERVTYGGVILHLLDTAGLRSTGDHLEAEGVRRAESLVEEADHILYLIDGSDAPARESAEEEVRRIQRANMDAQVWPVLTKRDLWVDGAPDALSVSVHDGSSVASLLDRLVKEVSGDSSSSLVALTQRQLGLISRIESMVAEVAALGSAETELVASELRRILDPLSELSGETTSEDVLGAIFESFCIGK